MSLESLLQTQGTLTLQQQTTGRDSSGGPTRTPWTTVANFGAVRCDVQPASSSVQERYRQRGEQVTHQIFLSVDIAARPYQRLILGARTFIIMGYAAPEAGRGPGYWKPVYVVDAQEWLT